MAAVAGLSAFVLFRPPTIDVIQRVASPDGVLDAVVARVETGATVGFVDWVYVLRRGAEVGGEPGLIADKIDGALTVAWNGNQEVDVTAKSARVFKWKSATVPLGNGVRSVTLKVRIAKLQIAGN